MSARKINARSFLRKLQTGGDDRMKDQFIRTILPFVGKKALLSPDEQEAVADVIKRSRGGDEALALPGVVAFIRTCG